MRLGISVARPNLVSLGTCFGKFSKSGKFKLHITALDYLAQYAKFKVLSLSLYPGLKLIVIGHLLQVWIKPNGEMPFLYGNHVLKAHLGRITEDTPEHQGVVVFSMSDVPLVRYPPRLNLHACRPLTCLDLVGLRCDCSVHSRHTKT